MPPQITTIQISKLTKQVQEYIKYLTSEIKNLTEQLCAVKDNQTPSNYYFRIRNFNSSTSNIYVQGDNLVVCLDKDNPDSNAITITVDTVNKEFIIRSDVQMSVKPRASNTINIKLEKW